MRQRIPVTEMRRLGGWGVGEGDGGNGKERREMIDLGVFTYVLFARALFYEGKEGDAISTNDSLSRRL